MTKRGNKQKMNRKRNRKLKKEFETLKNKQSEIKIFEKPAVIEKKKAQAVNQNKMKI